MAPLVLPAFVAAYAVEARWGGGRGLGFFVAAIGVSVLLALQPDASQALALLVGLTFAVFGSRAFDRCLTFRGVSRTTHIPV